MWYRIIRELSYVSISNSKVLCVLGNFVLDLIEKRNSLLCHLYTMKQQLNLSLALIVNKIRLLQLNACIA
jgi:hypothetical protein